MNESELKKMIRNIVVEAAGDDITVDMHEQITDLAGSVLDETDEGQRLIGGLKTLSEMMPGDLWASSKELNGLMSALTKLKEAVYELKNWDFA